MKSGTLFLLPIPLAALLGCTLPTATPPSSATPTGEWNNWQIQAGTAISSPPSTYPSFLGAIQIEGSQASGIFSTVNSTGSGSALDYGGTFNSSTDAIAMTTEGYGFSYTEPTTPYTLLPVSVIGGCVYPPGYTGAECNAIFSSPSVGVGIAPLNGTYTGTLTSSSTPGISGAATITFTQSSTPNAEGSFPLTAAVTFPSDSIIGTETYPLTGTVSGEGLSLSYMSAAATGPSVTLTASTNPAATRITVTNLTWAQTGLSFAFTGTLNGQ
jgi:hypothetical protein